MKKLTPYIIAVALVGFASLPMVSSAQSLTYAQLQTEIQSLLAEVQSLQQQLTAAGSGSATTSWCYSFNTNLSVGMSGAQVTALQTALTKNGESVNITGTFDSETAAAVSSFQEKYSSQVLTPNGLQAGTGYVGPSTRAELNSLFVCGMTTPIVTVTPPTPPPSPPTSTSISVPPIIVLPPPVICPVWGCNGAAPTSTPSTASTTMTIPLGATTGRAKSPTDKLGIISLAAGGFSGVSLDKITVTFTGSILNVNSSTFLSSVQLLDQNNVSVTSEDGATASVNPTAGTVTWTFGSANGGFFISSGEVYPFTVLVNSSAVPSLGSDFTESLVAMIQNASDIQYSDLSATDFGLPPTSVPLIINSVNYAPGE